jgi:hypothetical protein
LTHNTNEGETLKKFSNSQIASAALAFAGLLGAIASLMNVNLWGSLFSRNDLGSNGGLLATTVLVWLVLPWLSLVLGAAAFVPQLAALQKVGNITIPVVSTVWLLTDLYRGSVKPSLGQMDAFYLFGWDLPVGFLIPLALLVSAVLSIYAFFKNPSFSYLTGKKIQSGLFVIAGLFGFSIYFQYFKEVNDFLKTMFTTDGKPAVLEFINLILVPLLLVTYGVISLLPQISLPGIVSKYAPLVLTSFAMVGHFASYETGRNGWEYVANASPDPMAPLSYLSSLSLSLSSQPFWTLSIVLVIGLALGAVYRLSNPAPAPSLLERAASTRQFLNALVDSKIDNFISRKVSGVLYIIITWLTIWAVYLEVNYGLTLAFLGNAGGVLLMIVMPVALIFALVLTRMVFEASVALIAVAENTKK